MDDLDFQIADILDKNSRISNREIARQLNVSEKTVRHRINRMIDGGVLKLAALIDVENMPDIFLAICGIRLLNNIDMENSIERMKEIPEVISVMSVTGRYDLIAVIIVNSRKKLADVLTRKIDKIKGLNARETFVVLNNVGQFVSGGKLYEIINN